MKKPIKKSDIRLLSSFYQYLKPYRKWLIISFAAIPFSTGATVFLPWMIVLIIDKYLLVPDEKGLFLMSSLFALAVFVGFLSDSVYSYSLQRVGQNAVAKMREKLYSHCLTLPRSYFDKHPIGETLSRLTSDLEAIGESVAIGVLSLFTDIIKTIALFIFLLYFGLILNISYM